MLNYYFVLCVNCDMEYKDVEMLILNELLKSIDFYVGCFYLEWW